MCSCGHILRDFILFFSFFSFDLMPELASLPARGTQPQPGVPPPSTPPEQPFINYIIVCFYYYYHYYPLPSTPPGQLIIKTRACGDTLLYENNCGSDHKASLHYREAIMG